MRELLDRHIGRIALGMGRFLRGFEDPAVHVGTPLQFCREFRKALELPILRDPESNREVSYVHALEFFSAPAVETEADDPVHILMRGLSGPPATAAGPRREPQGGALRQDLENILRAPVMRFYFSVSDPDSFLRTMERIAFRRGLGRQSLHALPLVSSISAQISYDMLREAVALEQVQTYQEEGSVVLMSPQGADSV
jgi:hypothetical protein